MNFEEYQTACERTANRGLSGRDQMINWALGLAGESGEFIDHVKKVYFHGIDPDPEYMRKELGDILWYLSSAASTLGFDLEDIAERNIAKLRHRYPEKFVEGGGIRKPINNDHEDDGN